MKKSLLLLTVVIGMQYSAQAQDTITSAQAKKYVGKMVTLCDRVNYGKYVDISKEADIRLLVGPDYPNHNLTLIFPAADVKRFTFDPEAKMINKRFCVQGTITIYRDKPAIYVTKESQVNEEE
jgi:hypothetical protein